MKVSIGLVNEEGTTAGVHFTDINVVLPAEVKPIDLELWICSMLKAKGFAYDANFGTYVKPAAEGMTDSAVMFGCEPC